MRGTTTVRSRRLLFPIGQTGLLVTALLVAAQSSGCGRALHIKQDEYVNTAMHRNRAPAERTGEPLEINIVVVTPKDLEMEDRKSVV